MILSRVPSVVVVETSGAGGMAHYSFNLCEALARRVPVHLATAERYELEERPRSFEVHRVFRAAPVLAAMTPPERGVSAAANIANLGRLGALVARVRPDVVHVQGHVSPRLEPALVRVSRWLSGPPVVSTVHEVIPYERPEEFRAAWSAAYRAVDGLVIHSRFVAGELSREYGWRADASVIAHGDYSFFRPEHAIDRAAARTARGLPAGRRLALFFGYVRPYKGLDLLAEAWAAAVGAGLPEDVDLVVAGSVAADAEGHLEVLRSAAGPRLHAFPGYADETAMAEYLAAADVVVAPYRRCYTSGIVPLAFSFGLPVLATAVGSIPEQVRPGRNGLLAPPDDAVALARGLVRLFTECDLGRLGRGAAASAAALSWDSVARDTVAAYGAVLARARRHGRAGRYATAGT